MEIITTIISLLIFALLMASIAFLIIRLIAVNLLGKKDAQTVSKFKSFLTFKF